MPPLFEALAQRAHTSGRRSLALTVVTVMVAVAVVAGGQRLSEFRQQQATPTSGVAAPSATVAGNPTGSPKVVLPQPILQPITRTSAAAQVGWVISYSQDTPPVQVGIDGRGKVVGTITPTADDLRTFRSADGAVLAVIGDQRVTTYSALDGAKLGMYARRPAGGLTDATFSRDGRWLAVLSATTASVQMIDLQTGLTQATPLGHDPNAATPGMGGTIAGPIWSTLTFAPDSKRLNTIVDWGGPLRLTTFDVTPAGLAQSATAVDEQGGKSLVSCAGPGLRPGSCPTERR